jgi:uncharacterized membrane protein
MTNRDKTKKISTTAIFAAMIFVVTFFIRFAIPIASGGYVNLGDSVIFIASFILGGPLGGLAAAIGSSLSDLLAGYAYYALPTFIIKGLMGLVCGKISMSGRSYISSKARYISFLTGCIIAGAIMVGGYFVFELFLLGKKLAIASIGFNAMQWLFSILVAAVLYPSIKKIITKLMPNSDLSIWSPEGGREKD